MIGRAGTGARLAWTLAGCVGLAGCFAPHLKDAECLRCTGVCPGNLVCLDERCVDPSSPNSCPANSTGGTSSGAQGGDAGESSGAASDTGGTGNAGHGGSTSHGGHGGGGKAGAGIGGAGGTASQGGDAGIGGDPGTGGTSGSSISFTISTTTLCSDVPTGVTLRGKNGTPPYHFDFVGDAAGLSLVDDGDGKGASVSGTVARTGEIDVRIRVSDGEHSNTESVALTVNETPVLTTTSLPDVCPNQIYTATLAATGGDGTYTFEVGILDDWGLTLNGDQLQGQFRSADGQAGTLDVSVTVKSDGCASLPTTLALVEQAANATTCPRVVLADAASSLTRACATDQYSQSLAVVHGAPGYQWKTVSVPPGFSFDPGSQTVSRSNDGTPAAAGPVKVQVSDSNGRIIEGDFDMPTPTEKCWLAYLSPSAGSSRLSLFDPLLGNRHTIPDSPTSVPVLDFKFSPNGRLVAYRTSSDPSSPRLELLELASFRGQSFDFENVTHYAWADDGTTLAVAFETAQARVLGGVDLSGDGGSGTSLSYPELVPISALVDSELTWFSGSYVGFLTSLDVDFRELTMVARTSTSFTSATIREEDSFDDNSYLRPSPIGVFAVQAPPFNTDYFDINGAPPIPHQLALLPPNGSFAATQHDDTLAIFKPANSSATLVPAAVPDATATHCAALLAWAPGGDRVACSHAKSTGNGELMILDLDADAHIKDPITIRNGDEYVFPPLGHTGLARLFSPTGQRLAFLTDDFVYATPVAAGGSTVDLSYQFLSAPGGTDAVLAFSPDERYLLEHRGTYLSLFDLENPTAGPQPILLNGEALPVAPACSEDFTAPPGEYCGEFRSHASFTWSPDSTLVALGTSAGRLLVKDLRHLDQVNTIDVTDDCDSDCTAGNKFQFQP